MPLHPSYGPFEITVNSRNFDCYLSEDGTFDISHVDSKDGGLFISVRGDRLDVWGTDIAGASKKRPKTIIFAPENLTIRSPGDLAQSIIEWVLSANGKAYVL